MRWMHFQRLQEMNLGKVLSCLFTQMAALISPAESVPSQIVLKEKKLSKKGLNGTYTTSRVMKNIAKKMNITSKKIVKFVDC